MLQAGYLPWAEWSIKVALFCWPFQQLFIPLFICIINKTLQVCNSDFCVVHTQKLSLSNIQWSSLEHVCKSVIYVNYLTDVWLLSK